MSAGHFDSHPSTHARTRRVAERRRAPDSGTARDRSLDAHPLPGAARLADPGESTTQASRPGQTPLDRIRRSTVDLPATDPATPSVIRRFPVASFTNLNPYPGGTTIPAYYFNTRPPWLRGQPNSPATVRGDVAANRRSMTVNSPIWGEPAVTVYQCMLCGRWSPIEQLSVDHITDWQKYCKAAIEADDRQQFEQRYHDLDNLHLVHNNCNASKNATALFDWWQSRQAGDLRFNPGAVSRIKDALTRMFLLYGIDYLKEIDENKRADVVSGIVQQSSPNAFEHLMGNARITTAMGGWNIGAESTGGQEEEHMDTGDM